MTNLILTDTVSIQALQAQAFPLSFGVATLAGVVAGAVIYSLYVRKQLYVIPYLIAGFSAAVLIRYWMGMEAPLSIVRAVGDPDLLAFLGFLLALLATVHAFETFDQFVDDQPVRSHSGGTHHDGSGSDAQCTIQQGNPGE